MSAAVACWVAGLSAIAFSAEPSQSASPLRFVLTPYRGEAELKAAYRPLADRLSERLKRPVVLVVAENFGAPLEMLADGRAELAEVTPYAFVSGMERSSATDAGRRPIVPVVADTMLGRPGTGAIVVMETSKAKSLEDLKGSRFGFVDNQSSSGFLGPWATLSAKGLNPKTHFASYTFLGSHLAVLEALVSGSVDAGAVSRHTLDTIIRGTKLEDAKFRVLKETARMPGDVICASAALPEEQKKALQAELLGLRWDNAEDRKALEPTTRKGFGPVVASDYSWLLRVAAMIAD
jgi:phosphonate transport system substrate-binding protein